MSTVPAADSTLRLLTYLASHRRPVAASAVARDLGLPRSSVYHLLTVASARGFVVHLPAERRYALGPGHEVLREAIGEELDRSALAS